MILKRSLAVVLSASLLWSSGDFAQAAAPLSPLAELTPPSRLGQVTDSFNLSNPTAQRVILIQDLHAHYGVQKNIAGILEYLSKQLQTAAPQNGGTPEQRHPGTAVSGSSNNKNHSLPLRNAALPEGRLSGQPTLPFVLAVEGASGPVDSSILALLPDAKIKQAAADYLMREGELSGAEYFAVMRSAPRLLVGVEDNRYYDLHRQLFRKTWQDRDRLVTTLQGIQAHIRSLRPGVYSRAVKKIQAKEDALQAGRLGLSDYFDYLASEAQAAGIAFQRPDFSRNPAMEQIWEQADRLAFQLKMQKAKKSQEKDLVQVEHDLDFLMKVANLQATEREVRTFGPRINQFVALANALTHKSFDEATLRELISSSIDYYAFALARNKPMVENTLALLGQSDLKPQTSNLKKKAGTLRLEVSHLRSEVRDQPGVAVLVAGGFHTRQMTEMLRQRGVAYAVISPNVDEFSAADQALYVKRLNGQLLTEQEILAAAPQWPASPTQLAGRSSGNNSALAAGLGLVGTGIALTVALSASGHGAPLAGQLQTFIQTNLGSLMNYPGVQEWIKHIPLLLGVTAMGVAAGNGGNAGPADFEEYVGDLKITHTQKLSRVELPSLPERGLLPSQVQYFTHYDLDLTDPKTREAAELFHGEHLPNVADLNVTFISVVVPENPNPVPFGFVYKSSREVVIAKLLENEPLLRQYHADRALAIEQRSEFPTGFRVGHVRHAELQVFSNRVRLSVRFSSAGSHPAMFTAPRQSARPDPIRGQEGIVNLRAALGLLAGMLSASFIAMGGYGMWQLAAAGQFAAAVWGFPAGVAAAGILGLIAVIYMLRSGGAPNSAEAKQADFDSRVMRAVEFMKNKDLTQVDEGSWPAILAAYESYLRDKSDLIEALSVIPEAHRGLFQRYFVAGETAFRAGAEDPRVIPVLAQYLFVATSAARETTQGSDLKQEQYTVKQLASITGWSYEQARALLRDAVNSYPESLSVFGYAELRARDAAKPGVSMSPDLGRPDPFSFKGFSKNATVLFMGGSIFTLGGIALLGWGAFVGTLPLSAMVIAGGMLIVGLGLGVFLVREILRERAEEARQKMLAAASPEIPKLDVQKQRLKLALQRAHPYTFGFLSAPEPRWLPLFLEQVLQWYETDLDSGRKGALTDILTRSTIGRTGNANSHKSQWDAETKLLALLDQQGQIVNDGGTLQLPSHLSSPQVRLLTPQETQRKNLKAALQAAFPQTFGKPGAPEPVGLPKFLESVMNAEQKSPPLQDILDGHNTFASGNSNDPAWGKTRQTLEELRRKAEKAFKAPGDIRGQDGFKFVENMMLFTGASLVLTGASQLLLKGTLLTTGAVLGNGFAVLAGLVFLAAPFINDYRERMRQKQEQRQSDLRTVENSAKIVRDTPIGNPSLTPPSRVRTFLLSTLPKRFQPESIDHTLEAERGALLMGASA